VTGKLILDIGQCDADHFRIARMLGEMLDAGVIRAHSLDEARQLLESQTVDLILVNRLLDRDGSSGIAVIEALLESESSSAAPVMLVSNYEDAQRAAMAAGAARGFGKNALGDPATIERLKDFLASA
jgi:response regulator RpfG family c-di-GMP phosphodiesterase